MIELSKEIKQYLKLRYIEGGKSYTIFNKESSAALKYYLSLDEQEKDIINREYSNLQELSYIKEFPEDTYTMTDELIDEIFKE